LLLALADGPVISGRIDMDINARMTIESTFEYVEPVEPDADTE
jgi:tryptophan synthase alpha subunit